MSQGKFSNPRPHRDEERQIEQAFRQVTGQEPVPQPRAPLHSEDAQLEQMLRDAPQSPASRPAAKTVPTSLPNNKQNDFDLLPEDVDAFFDGIAPAFTEEPTESEPDFIDKMGAFFEKAMTFFEKNQKMVLAGACGGALLLILGFIGVFFLGASDPNDNVILDNVYLADIPVGGMTKEEAFSAVRQATNGTYSVQDLLIDLSGTQLPLSPKDTKADLDVKAAVNAAYDYGRTGTKAEQEQALANSRAEQHIIGLLPYLELDTDYIYGVLSKYAEDTGSTLTQATYGLEGSEPELRGDKFNENAPTQTLVITMGTPGVGFDVKDVYDQVLDAYSLHLFLVEVENVESVKDPDPVDLQAIYKEFYIAPVNASVNLQTFETQSGSYGYGFDLEAAQKLVDAAAYGEEVRIPMEYIAPDILDDDSFFKDTLGEYRTRTTANPDRTTNLALACEAINGTILNPGETLSFSSNLNNSRGYKNAPEDTGMEDTDKGGVSQVSSTLYAAALLSDLTIASRSNHGYIPSFIDQGLDAVTSLKVSNSTGYPIRIDAKVSGGYVEIQILGTEERSHYVVLETSISNTYQPTTEYQDFAFDNEEGYKDGDVIEEGTTGYLVKSYKVKYDMESGKELSRDFIANSQYPAGNKIVARVEPEPTTEPTTVPTTEATQPSTEAPKPTETTAPPETTQATQPPTTVPATEATEPSAAPTTAPTVPAATSSAEEPAATQPQQEAPAADTQPVNAEPAANQTAE